MNKLYAILIFAFGIGIGCFINNWDHLKFKTDIDLIRLIGLVVNAMIFIYIATILNEKSSAKRFNKEYIVKRIEVFLKMVSEFNDQLNNNKRINERKHVLVGQFETNNLFKQFSTSLNKVETLIQHVNYDLEQKELKKDILTLKKSITNKKPVEESYQLSTMDVCKCSNVILSIEKKILTMIMDINNR